MNVLHIYDKLNLCSKHTNILNFQWVNLFSMNKTTDCNIIIHLIFLFDILLTKVTTCSTICVVYNDTEKICKEFNVPSFLKYFIS